MIACEWRSVLCENEAVGFIGYDDDSFTYACEACFTDHTKNTTLKGGVHFGYEWFNALEVFEREYNSLELEVL